MNNENQRLKYGDIIYIILQNSNENNYFLSCKNLSYKSKTNVHLHKQEDTDYSNYDDNLFIIYPSPKDKYFETKNLLEEKLSAMKQQANNKYDHDENLMENTQNLLVKLNETKAQIYEQNEYIVSIIGKPVQFSQKFILIHVKTEMILCAELVSNVSSFFLVDICVEDCLLSFYPYNKYDQITDDVFTNQNLLIKKVEKNLSNNSYLTFLESKRNTTDFMSRPKMMAKTSLMVNLNLLINSDNQDDDILLNITVDFSLARPFKIRIVSDHIDSNSQNLSFRDTIIIKLNNSDKYLVNFASKNGLLTQNNKIEKSNRDVKNTAESKVSLRNLLLNSKTQKNYSRDNLKAITKEFDNNLLMSLSSYMYFSKIKNLNTELYNLLSFFKPEPMQLSENLKNNIFTSKISNYIEFNQKILLKHVISGKYLSFCTKDLNKNTNIVGIGRIKCYGLLQLLDEPNSDCEWMFMESYIILDREKYEENKIKGLSTTSRIHITKEKKYVQKKDIVRLFHIKLRKFISEEDINEIGDHHKTNEIESISNRLNIKSNKNMKSFKNDIALQRRKSIETLTKSINNSNIYNKFCFTLNKNPHDNDLIRLVTINSNLSWEVNLILHFSSSYLTYAEECVHSESSVKEILSLLSDYNNFTNTYINHEKVNEDEKKIKGSAFLKIKSNKNEEKIENITKLELSQYLKKSIKTAKQWESLKFCFEDLKNYCLNMFIKRYNFTVQIGKPVIYRQEMLKEQGILELTLNFLNIVNELKDQHLKFQIEYDKYQKNHNPINIKNKKQSIKQLDSDIEKMFKAIFESTKQLFTELSKCFCKGFEFIESMCKDNSESMDYVFKNRKIFDAYLLVYKEAAKCIIDIIKDDDVYMEEIISENINFKFRKQLHDTEYDRRPENYKIKSLNLKNEKVERSKSVNLIDSIILYLDDNITKYDKYTFGLLSKLMKGENRGITNNQEYIFYLLILNEKYRKFMIKLEPKKNDTMFYLTFTNEIGFVETKTLTELCSDLTRKSDYENLIIGFLSVQLNIYADMCFGRNYICIEKIRELFPLDHLIYHIANINIKEDILEGLINILNYCYIDCKPHHKRIFPDMIKIINNNNMKIEKNVFKCETFLPSSKLNLIICISLYILYNIKYGKLTVNHSNVNLLSNLLNFQLYSDNFIFNGELYFENFKKKYKEESREQIQLKEEIKRIIQLNDPVLINKDYEIASKQTFYETIGYQLFETESSDSSIGNDFIVILVKLMNDFLLENILLSNINPNLQNMHILSQTPKPFIQDDVVSLSNLNYLLKVISSTKDIISSSKNINIDTDSFPSDSNNRKLIEPSEERKKKEEEYKKEDKKIVKYFNFTMSFQEYLPFLKQLLNVYEFIMNIKTNDSTDLIIINYFDISSEIILENFVEFKKLFANGKTEKEIYEKINFQYCLNKFLKKDRFQELMMNNDNNLFNILFISKTDSNNTFSYYNDTGLKTTNELVLKIIDNNFDTKLTKVMINLLYMINSQRSNIINTIKRTKIIYGKEEEDRYYRINSLIQELQNFSENTEIWLKPNISHPDIVEDDKSLDKSNSTKNQAIILKNKEKETNPDESFIRHNKSFDKVEELIYELIKVFYTDSTCINYKPIKIVTITQTTCFSMNLHKIIFFFINEICQKYPKNIDFTFSKDNLVEIRSFKSRVDTLIQKLMKLLKCLILDNIDFQEIIQIDFLSLNYHIYLYNLGYLDVLNNIIKFNNKFCLENYDLLMKIFKTEASSKKINKLFIRIRYYESALIKQNVSEIDPEELIDENINETFENFGAKDFKNSIYNSKDDSICESNKEKDIIKPQNEYKLAVEQIKQRLNLKVNESSNNTQIDNNIFNQKIKELIKNSESLNNQINQESVNIQDEQPILHESVISDNFINAFKQNLINNLNEDDDDSNSNIFPHKNHQEELMPLTQEKFEEQLIRIDKVLKLINTLIEKFKDEKFIHQSSKYFETTIQILSENDINIPKINFMNEEVRENFEFILIYKLKILNQIIKFAVKLFEINPRIKLLIDKYLNRSMLERKIMQLEYYLNDNKNLIKNNEITISSMHSSTNITLEYSKILISKVLFKLKKNSLLLILKSYNTNQLKEPSLVNNICLSIEKDMLLYNKIRGTILKNLNTEIKNNNKKLYNNDFHSKALLKEINSVIFPHFFKNSISLLSVFSNNILHNLVKFVANYQDIYLNLQDILNKIKYLFNSLIKNKEIYLLTSKESEKFLTYIYNNLEFYCSLFGQFRIEIKREWINNKGKTYNVDRRDMNFFDDVNNTHKSDTIKELSMIELSNIKEDIESEEENSNEDSELNSSIRLSMKKNSHLKSKIRKNIESSKLSKSIKIDSNERTPQSSTKSKNELLKNNQSINSSSIKKLENLGVTEKVLIESTVDLTQDLISEILNYDYTDLYVKHEQELLAKRLKSQIDYQVIFSYYFKNNDSLSNFKNPNSFHILFVFINFIQNNYNKLKHYKEIGFILSLASLYIESKPDYLIPLKQVDANFVFKYNVEKLEDFCRSYVQGVFIENTSVEIFLKILSENNNSYNQKLLPATLKLFVNILEGNNTVAQNKIYRLLNFLPDSENFLYYLTSLFNYDIYIFLRNDITVDNFHVDKELLEVIISVLKFMKNLTEGHNSLTQEFIRIQIANRISYNFINIIIDYLSMLIAKISSIVDTSHIEPSLDFLMLYYYRIVQCFETLCEFNQGPCNENQNTMISSKIFEISDRLLRELDYIEDMTDDSKADEILNKRYISEIENNENYENVFTQTNEFESSIENGSYQSDSQENQHNEKDTDKTTYLTTLNQYVGKSKTTSKIFARLYPYEKSNIILKIGLVLNSIIEGRRFKSALMKKIIRDFDYMLFYNKLLECYLKLQQLSNTKAIELDFFLYEPHLYNKNKIIVESGFLLYYFISTVAIFENKQSEFSLFYQKINKDEQEELIKEIGECNAISSYTSRSSQYSKLKEGILFFRNNTLHVEIVKDDKIQKLFFPKLNFFNFFSDELLLEFRLNSNRASTQTKVASIFQNANHIYDTLKQGEKIYNFTKKLSYFGVLFNKPKVFQYLAFIFSILMNILILSGYVIESDKVDNKAERLKNIQLFHILDLQISRQIVLFIGSMLCICSIMVFIEFSTKKAPLIYQTYLKNYYNFLYDQKKKALNNLEIGTIQTNFQIKRASVIWKKFKVILSLLTNIEVLYEVGYLGFAILAFGLHYFFFAYHLIDFIRTQQILINVLKSIYNSRIQLVFTLAFYLLLIYFYSLIFYYFYYDDMPPYSCDSVFQCLATVFANTSVDNMYEILTQGGNDNRKGSFARFIVEISFTMILVWLIFQMVTGLIVDTFSTLRKETDDFENDLNNICYICGLEREEIEKVYVGKFGFNKHLQDHNLKSYFCFIFYLKEKNPIELTGIESYIKDLIDESNGSWIPYQNFMIKELENDK